ncbi:MAG: carbohydrate kinase family protein [Rhodoglobus sp.]
MRLLVAGDVNVDLVLRGDVIPRFGQEEQLLDNAELVVGGSASIMASGLGRLGVDTHLVAVLGDDDFGRFMLSSLAAVGVGTAHIATENQPTGISVILSAPEDRAILTLPGTVPVLTAAQVRAAVEDLAPHHVHFAAYFMLPALAPELPDLLRWLRGRAITTSLDTNWDPAGQWSGVTELLPLVDLVMPNLEELRAIARRVGVASGASDEQAARAIAAHGPRVVVKAGADGAWSVGHETAVISSRRLTVSVVDTTGAGDSFDAGYLAAMADGIVDEQLRLRWATAAGSLSTRAAGGTAAQATRGELDQAIAL